MSIKYFIKKIVLSNRITKKLFFSWVRRSRGRKYANLNRTDIFNSIYENARWGAERDTEEFIYYSGEGSHKDEYVIPYRNMIRTFISKNHISSVVDLGCGDFNVASGWVTDDIDYIGIDIVQKMIDSHNRKYADKKRVFICRDIVKDDLPCAELCLVRQVFQHLSNDEIICVLNKLKKYKYIIITEHVTAKEDAEAFNVDIRAGHGTRVELQSGVYPDESPFNAAIEDVLLRLPYKTHGIWKEELVSVLIRND